jgi:DNA processing protein
MLHVLGSLDGFLELIAGPVVALIGSERPSEYGVEMAGSLARGLSVSGVTVASVLRPGVAAAALCGALEAGRPSIAICADGTAASAPAAVRVIRRRLLAGRGCLISELPGDVSGRGWGRLAAERALAGLASVAVLVEAREDEAALATARLAETFGCALAALPGPVTSVLSAGPHALIAEGAAVVRGAADVLERLSVAPATAVDAAGAAPAASDDGLEPRLRGVLEAVGAGRDTFEALASDPTHAGEALAALAELEVLGLLRRTGTGRYVVRDPPPTGGRAASG